MTTEAMQLCNKQKQPKRSIKLKNQQLYHHKIAISGNGAIVEITFLVQERNHHTVEFETPTSYPKMVEHVIIAVC